jgi:hypothetical protein
MRDIAVACLFNSEHAECPVQLGTAPRAGVRHTPGMFDLIATMKRGSASSLPPAWRRYPSVDAARVGAAAMLRDERVQRVLIVRDEIPHGFVEWQER